MKATNFDIRISRDTALLLLNPCYNGKALIDFNNYEIMCKEYGDDTDWVGMVTDEYEMISESPEYKTFEIQLGNDNMIDVISFRLIHRESIVFERAKCYFLPSTGMVYTTVNNSMVLMEPNHITDIEVKEWFDNLTEKNCLSIRKNLPRYMAVRNQDLINRLRETYIFPYENIHTIQDVFYFFDILIHREQLIFNPDTPFTDYIRSGTDEPVYTEAQAITLSNLLDQCSTAAYDSGLNFDALYTIATVIDGSYKQIEEEAQYIFTPFLKY